MEPRYLNNGGTRWISEGMVRVVGIYNGKHYYKMRKPMYWEQFGNFALCCVKVGDTVFKGFTHDNKGVIELDLMKCRRNK